MALFSLASFDLTHAENVNYSVTVEDSLSISVSSSGIVLDLNPAVEEFKSKELTVKVGTNNRRGYKLYINTNNNETNLTKIDDTSSYIENITSETNQTNFPTNYWGYKVNSNVLNHTNYNPFISGTLISQSNTATNEDTSTLTFAAKANLDKPAGSYKLDLEFEAVANFNYKDLDEIEYMQELTPGTVIAATEGQTATLKDSRDEQEYTVAKILGNLWMTKNLNIAGGTELTPEKSNVTTEYTLPNSSTSGFNDDAGQFLYNSGLTDCSVRNSPCYSYYSFVTANAGNNPSDSDTGDPDQDICPKGWRLPTYDNYVTLIAEYNTGPKMINGPFHGDAFTGRYYNSAYVNGGPYSMYQTSNSASDTIGWLFYINNSITEMRKNVEKSNGLAVRCLAKTE